MPAPGAGPIAAVILELSKFPRLTNGVESDSGEPIVRRRATFVTPAWRGLTDDAPETTVSSTSVD